MAWQIGDATAIAGLAVISLCTLYKDNAPSLAELRDAGADGGPTHQQLSDADFSVGSIAVISGVAMAWLTKDLTALILICVALGSYMLWFHAILNRNPTPRETTTT